MFSKSQRDGQKAMQFSYDAYGRDKRQFISRIFITNKFPLKSVKRIVQVFFVQRIIANLQLQVDFWSGRQCIIHLYQWFIWNSPMSTVCCFYIFCWTEKNCASSIHKIKIRQINSTRVEIHDATGCEICSAKFKFWIVNYVWKTLFEFRTQLNISRAIECNRVQCTARTHIRIRRT